MANTRSTPLDDKHSPKCLVKRKVLPKSDCAAVAPKQTIVRGLMTRISASSHGLQAFISRALGLAWSRRVPRGAHLKCFTALVK